MVGEGGYKPDITRLTLLRGLTNHGYQPLTNLDDPPSNHPHQPPPTSPRRFTSTSRLSAMRPQVPPPSSYCATSQPRKLKDGHQAKRRWEDTYCWWFRNPAPLIGSLAHDLQVLYIPDGAGFQPSTVLYTMGTHNLHFLGVVYFIHILEALKPSFFIHGFWGPRVLIRCM